MGWKTGIAAVAVLLAAIMAIKGCGLDSQPLEGKWSRQGYVLEFRGDGTGVYTTPGGDTENFTYHTDGNVVRMGKTVGWLPSDSPSWSISDDRKVLTIGGISGWERSP